MKGRFFLLALLFLSALSHGGAEVIYDVDLESPCSALHGWKGFARWPGYFGYQTDPDGPGITLVRVEETEAGPPRFDSKDVEPRFSLGRYILSEASEPHQFVIVSSETLQVSEPGVIIGHNVYPYDVDELFDSGDSIDPITRGVYNSYSPVLEGEGSHGLLFLINPDSVVRFIELKHDIPVPTGFGVQKRVRQLSVDERVSEGQADFLFVLCVMDSAGFVVSDMGVPYRRYPFQRYLCLKHTPIIRGSVLGVFEEENALIAVQVSSSELYVFEYKALEQSGDPVDTLSFEGEITCLRNGAGAIWAGVQGKGIYRLFRAEGEMRLATELVHETDEPILQVAAIPSRYDPNLVYVAFGDDRFSVLRWSRD
jgi:hypothetical protein